MDFTSYICQVHMLCYSSKVMYLASQKEGTSLSCARNDMSLHSLLQDISFLMKGTFSQACPE